MSDLQMRVSDADRERGARKLQEAFMEGRLTQLELEDRLELALTARTYGDLAGLTADLPADGPAVDGPVVDEVVELESKNGHIKRSGDWAVPRRLRVASKYGSVELDLSEAVISHPVVEIHLDLKYGSAKIVLPDGAAADIDRFRTEWGNTVTSEVPGRPQPGALYLVVSGEAKYGSLAIRYPRKRWFTH
ncbi:DUF1707 domain-containing protein [Nonomuraea sp. NPDC050680]|uniref:DUF1707 SHOCT-like domain-containing protein n=1 Tax=Nonomuraea sp. NPDC050680 TaxID=3154630 RepID=UPI00340A5B3F